MSGLAGTSVSAAAWDGSLGGQVCPHPAEREDRAWDEPPRALPRNTDEYLLLPAGLGWTPGPPPGGPEAPPLKFQDPSRVLRDQQDPQMGANS